MSSTASKTGRTVRTHQDEPPPFETKAMLGRVFGTYVKHHWPRIVLAIGCMVIMAFTTALFAHLIEPLFDGGFIRRDKQILYTVPAVLLGLTILKSVATYIQTYQLEYIAQSATRDIQHELYAKLMRHDLNFAQHNPPAELTNRFVYDLQRLSAAITPVVGGGPREAMLVIGLMANLFWKDPLLAAASLVIIPLTTLPIMRFGRLLRKYSKVQQEQAGTMASQLTEGFALRRQIQADTAEDRVIKQGHTQINDVFNITLKAARARAASSPALEVVATLAIIGVIYVALLRAVAGVLSPGEFASFLTTLLLIVRPVKSLTNINVYVQVGLAAAARTFELLDEPLELHEKPGAKKLKVGKGEIVFDKVNFNYDEETNVLKKFSLTVPAGQTYALVGSSGAGKSTVLNLIPRFFEANNGKVLVDGQDISDVTLKSLRENIALVSQDVAVFQDTVAANIRFARPKATQKEVEAAAKAARAHDFIKELPDGYKTKLGKNGVQLSGGQRQRLAIARALLKDAPILLLDEATAALDTKTEKKLQGALDKLCQGRTVVVVAHRLSTISGADQIVVMEKGKIAEQGTHDELLKKGKHYAKLWQMQGTQAE